MSTNLADSVMPNNAAFAMRLARNIKGEVLFDRASRGRYSTDASIYQMEPVGVIVPETIDDVVAAMAIARDEGIPVLARGGGTSQCGQTVNRALVIDCSKHLRRILHVDAEARTALVEPGPGAGAPEQRAALATNCSFRSIPRPMPAARSAAWRGTTPAARNPSATG